MRHKRVAPLLADLLEGRLSSRLRGGVQRHAASCATCLAVIDSYKAVAEGFRAEEGDAPSSHPPVAELVDLALGAEEVAGEGRALLAAHLQACRSCAQEVELVRRSQAEVEGGPAGLRLAPGWRLAAFVRSPLAAPLAAGIVVLVLAYPAFLGIGQLPRIREELEALRAEHRLGEAKIETLTGSLADIDAERRRLASWTGTVLVPLLTAPIRGGALRVTEIPVAPEQPFICLAVDPGLPDRDPEGLYRGEVLRGDGGIAWSLEVKPEEVRRHLARAGSLTFLVPATELPPGSYRLRLFRSSHEGERQLLEAAFAIVPGASTPERHLQSPAATKAPQKNG